MGANPVPLSFTEAYSSMQTGVVDAVELPVDFIYNNGFHELGDYLIMTNHYFYANVLIINDDKFESMPEDLQEIILNAASEAGEFQTEISTNLSDGETEWGRGSAK